MQYIVYIAFEGQRLQISIGDWAKIWKKAIYGPSNTSLFFILLVSIMALYTLTTITKVTFCNIAHFSPYKKVQKLANEGQRASRVEGT